MNTMNSLKKYMYPLFETICVQNGSILHTAWHQKRFQEAYRSLFRRAPRYDLLHGISIPSVQARGRVKLKIRYGEDGKEHSFSPYAIRPVNSLKLLVDDQISYPLKRTDRSHLESLWEQRNGCDDILIVKNGHICDSLYANLVFFDGSQWLTPTTYLLNGTCRQRLLWQGSIREIPLKASDISKFKGFQLINAMLGFDPEVMLPIANILA